MPRANGLGSALLRTGRSLLPFARGGGRVGVVGPNEINEKKPKKNEHAPPVWAFGPMGLISSALGEPQRETRRL